MVDDVGVYHSVVHHCLLSQLMLFTYKELRAVDALPGSGDEVEIVAQ